MLTKKEIVEQLANETKVAKAKVKEIIEKTFAIIANKVAGGEKVRIVSFGTFWARTRAARLGRNPKTGQRWPIAQTKTPAFLSGKELRDMVKGRKRS